MDGYGIKVFIPIKEKKQKADKGGGQMMIHTKDKS